MVSALNLESVESGRGIIQGGLTVCDERWWFRERERELGVVKKNHVDACALGWRTCPKQQATHT